MAIRSILIQSLTFAFSGTLFLALGQTPCANLKSLSLPNATITAAESVAAGPYRAPGRGPAAVPAGRGRAGGRGRGPQPPPIMLPAHCRVALTLRPSTDSDIEMEVWMPASDWNGKFEAVGNGGWAGSITFTAMAAALKEGYATASNDTGHKGQDPAFALGHPEKLVDFAYRSDHDMALKSKALIKAFYGRNPRLSYWNGCSTGGRQGLMEAQKYPADFDGVIAGAPANPQTHLHSWDMMVATTVLKNAPNYFLTRGKLQTVNKAVLAACDALDGVKDGLLTDPRKCHFDPSALLCKGADSDSCLTQAQVDAVKLVYSPAKKKDGELIFPGKEPGGETGWPQLNPARAPLALSMGTFQFATYQDANWDWRNFDLDRDTAAADEKFGYVNATPDLAAFKAHGGKLLLYHGWNDQLISPENTVNYYSSVLQKLGPNQSSWMRLFMVPGMQHCQGGPGPDQFNKMGVIERWRESGKAPDQIVAYHVTGNSVDMSRPLCPYPQVAVYNGVGSTNDAASFSCKAR
ncbi:MAG TPA: tannase/feruloyl esterase family alpha/beta hydrolase [Bryobacteraceae bacterium]|nr:tannase/feruloyl esterase family alpha/beta hydrolase [Bryobacteraceae bacterium]